MLRISSAFIAVVAASATLRTKVAANPAAPVWPKEFTATIDQVDVSRNHTDTFNQAYSYSNQAVQNIYVNRGFDFETFQDFKTQRRYEVFNETDCRSFPEPGTIWVPPVATFTYNGTATINGQATYKWLGRIYRDNDLEYFSSQSNGYPVAFYDHSTEFQTFFNSFKAVTSWPNGQFTPPASCQQ